MIFVEGVKVELLSQSSRPGYHVEASTIGLKPGHWPDDISATDAAGEPLEFKKKNEVRGALTDEFYGYIYTAPDYRLTVYND